VGLLLGAQAMSGKSSPIATKILSSYEVARDLGVTQKSAWFMMHRIRKAMQSGNFRKFGGPDGGEVEADEAFIGGKPKNMHNNRRRALQ
jgi:hypothetical protein